MSSIMRRRLMPRRPQSLDQVPVATASNLCKKNGPQRHIEHIYALLKHAPARLGTLRLVVHSLRTKGGHARKTKVAIPVVR
ncbi:hypothetical protein R70006_03157 [Paraburkholderia domus]|nr:hypothetical protein R70006_03157 [Paraburkholderia domus]